MTVMLDKLFSSVSTLQRGLNASWLRNEVIGNNIANVDTPGFKASHVQFEDLVAEAVDLGEGSLKMAVTDEDHIPHPGSAAFDGIEPEIVKDDTTSTRLDGNNVNIDNEMVEMAKNSINYYATINKINSEFRKLNSAING
jgi:flagellar basal-body rod protein FlgB